jgi:nucleoid-associated protein YgaU
LPEGRYTVKNAAQKQIAKVGDALATDARQEKEMLRKQLVSAPKPLVYNIGSVNDGGTLSGIARLFYGDATKWKIIYEANRQTIKNPNIISGRMKLTIPQLP